MNRNVILLTQFSPVY